MVISERSAAKEIRCPNCGLVQAVPEFGPVPQAAPDPAPQPPRPRMRLQVSEPPPKEHGFVGDCLRSILFALRALPRMLVVMLALFGTRVMYDLYFGSYSPARSICCMQIILPLIMGAWVYAMIGFALRYFLDVSAGALDCVGKTPAVPSLSPGQLLEYGLIGLGMIFLYALPLVTLPLLPLGLLALTYSEDTRPFDIRWAVRAARRFPRQFGRLWALLIVLCGPLAAGIWGVSRGMAALSTYLAERSGGSLGKEMLAAGVGALGAWAAALVACVLLCVLLRCVGLFGRYYPEVLESLPEKPPTSLVLALLIVAGVAASLAVNYAIYRLLGGM
jgi:hypothetical protein